MKRSTAVALACAGLALVSLIYFAPILIDPATRVAGGRGDPMLVAYLVTWVAEHLWTAHAWNPPFLHPAPNVLAYSDHFYGLAVLAWPAVAAGVSPTAIVNAIAWLAFFLTSAAIFWWLLDTRGDVMPLAAAAVTVTYCAWRAQQLSHPHLLFLPFLPLALLCFARAIEGRGPRWLVWIGAAALAVQTLSVASLAVFVLPLVAVWVFATALLARRRDPGIWLALGLALVVAGLANLPAALHYWQLGGAFERSPVEVARFSADWPDWLSVPASHWLYGDRLAFTRGLERELFPGVGFAVVTAIGLAAAIRSDPAGRRAIWPGVLTALFALWAATGPSPPGTITLAHLPYDVLVAIVPGMRHVRVPARFVVIAAVFLAPAVAAGWAHLFGRLWRTFSNRLLAGAMAMALLILTVAEGLPGLAGYDAVTYLDDEAVPRETASGAVVFLPLGEPDEEIRRMWLARRSGVPLVNGFSGHPSYLWEALRYLQDATGHEEIRGALYSRLLNAGVDTVVASSPATLIDHRLLRPLTDRVHRITADLPVPRVRAIGLGRGVGLLVPEFGWSYPEGDATDSWMWTLDRRATMLVPMDGMPLREIALRVRSLHPDFRERIELWWNGQLIGVRTLRREPEIVTLALPAGATTAGWQRFELRGPPSLQVPGSPDPRRLSLCVYEITLR